MSRCQDSWNLESWNIQDFRMSRFQYFWILEILTLLKSWMLSNPRLQGFNIIEILKAWNFTISRFQDSWKLEYWKMLYFKSSRIQESSDLQMLEMLEVLNLETVKISRFQDVKNLGLLQSWKWQDVKNLEILNLEQYKISWLQEFKILEMLKSWSCQDSRFQESWNLETFKIARFQDSRCQESCFSRIQPWKPQFVYSFIETPLANTAFNSRPSSLQSSAEQHRGSLWLSIRISKRFNPKPARTQSFWDSVCNLHTYPILTLKRATLRTFNSLSPNHVSESS